MKVYYDIDELPDFGAAVATVGSFDGVHAGHRQILSHLTETAFREKRQSVVITFSPHPRQILEKKSPLRLLNTLDEKLLLLEGTGLDNVIVVPFTEEFSRTPWNEFVEQFLIRKIGVGTLVVGYDHHFGRAKEGSYHHLNRSPEKFGLVLKYVPPRDINGSKVSSSIIRELIQTGKMDLAAQYLTYPYFIRGEVLSQSIDEEAGKVLHVGNRFKLIPSEGIYETEISGTEENGVMTKANVVVDSEGNICLPECGFHDGQKVMVFFV